jgi:DNA-binding transcriptional LysR family regulator
MRAGLAALSSDRAAEVSVAASLTVAEFILPRWLGKLHAVMPEVQPRLHVVNSDRVAELVRDGEVDVGFIETAARPVDLAKRVVGSDRLIVVVAPGDPWARHRHPVGTEALLRARWVLREEGSGTRSTFESALRAVPQMAMEASSTTALIGAALAGVGPAVVSARAVLGELETGRLVEVRTDLDLLRPLTAIWLKDVRMPLSVAELLRIAAATSDSVRE